MKNRRLLCRQLGCSWWRHQMETFSALLAICAGNSPVPGEFPHKGQWRGAWMFSLICVWINDWVNNREAGDLRRHRTHYNVIVIYWCHPVCRYDNLMHYMWRQCWLVIMLDFRFMSSQYLSWRRIFHRFKFKWLHLESNAGEVHGGYFDKVRYEVLYEWLVTWANRKICKWAPCK